MKPRCDQCRFGILSKGVGVASNGNTQMIICHGTPPMVHVKGPEEYRMIFPLMRPDDWCGCFKQRKGGVSHG